MPRAPADPLPPQSGPQPGPQFPNPSMRLDSNLGMVVIEFRDPGGEVTRSIPSQRQIDAYRSHQIDALPGTKPAQPAQSPAENASPPAIVDPKAVTKDTA